MGFERLARHHRWVHHRGGRSLRRRVVLEDHRQGSAGVRGIRV